MITDLKKYFDELLFVSLGGTNQIGLNMYAYHYRGKWLIVDMGLGFADEEYPGVDILVPDIAFLEQIRDDIVGLVITHAHEDHIGAIQYLWPELKIPVYATRFTATVLKTKLSGEGLADEVPIHVIGENSAFNVAPFSLEFVSLTHSVPEMQGVVVRTDRGMLFHTGDWKFDDNPVVGAVSDKAKLAKLGDEGVLAIVCDSTNIFVEGRSGSEGDLQKSLNDLVAGFGKHLVVVTTFASNVARLYSIMRAAENCGRRVVLSGTSLWRMYHAAVDCGYLADVEPPLQPRQLNKLNAAEVLVIATGCQGEQFASVRKMARVEHPDIKLSRGDVVVFASKIIPGNEGRIFKLFNKLSRLGVEVLTEKDHFVHVSGHPCRDEMEEMYRLLRPQYSIPMHGEPMHTHEHMHFVKKKKLATPLQVEDGAVVLISEEKCKVIGKVHTGHMVIDGNFIIPSTSDVLKVRRHMRDQGAVVVTIVHDNKSVVTAPVVIAPGVLDPKEDIEYYETVMAQLMDSLKGSNFKAPQDIESRVLRIIKRFFKQETGKEPRIFVQLIKV